MEPTRGHIDRATETEEGTFCEVALDGDPAALDVIAADVVLVPVAKWEALLKNLVDRMVASDGQVLVIGLREDEIATIAREAIPLDPEPEVDAMERYHLLCDRDAALPASEGAEATATTAEQG